MVSRVISPQIKLRCNLSSFGENRATTETCGCGCNLCGSSAKKQGRDDHRTNTSCPTVRPEGNLFKRIKFIQLPVHRIKKSVWMVHHWLFQRCHCKKKPVEHSGALCCTDYKRVLLRSTWVVVPFSLERFKRLYVMKLNTAVPNCNNQTSFLIISAAKKELWSSYLKPCSVSE